MTTPACIELTIYQGATFREAFHRFSVAYPVREACGTVVKTCSGEPVPDADKVPEDYTGCTARVQLRRKVDDPEVLAELTTENGGIELDGAWLRLLMTAEQTAALVYGRTLPGWVSCIGQVEVTRPGGEVERQYELGFVLMPEGTR